MQITRYFLPDLGYVAGELAMAVTGVALFASGAVWTLVKPCAGIQDQTRDIVRPEGPNVNARHGGHVRAPGFRGRWVRNRVAGILPTG
jgi:hypothetical protein